MRIVGYAICALCSLFVASCKPSSGDKQEADKHLAFDKQISKRIEQDFKALPGTSVVRMDGSEEEAKPIISRGPSGGGSSSPETGERFYKRGFSLDLSSIELTELWDAVERIDPKVLTGVPALNKDGGVRQAKKWEDIVARAKRGTVLTDRLGLSIGLWYADRFSGLGMNKRHLQNWVSADGGGNSVIIKSQDKSHVVDVTVWVSVPEARAHVTIAYFAHWGMVPLNVGGQASDWGTQSSNGSEQ